MKRRKSLAYIPVKNPPPKRRREPLWGGPMKDGITNSLLGKYLVCRERFRLQVVEGLAPIPRWNTALDYGNLWHECEEAHAAGKDWRPTLKRYTRYLLEKFPDDEKEVAKYSTLCRYQFPIYVDYWKEHKDEKDREPLFQEEVFEVPYTLPSGRTIILRGKFDAGWIIRRGVYLQENKSKGWIDEDGILRTVDENIQTMFYTTALIHCQNIRGFNVRPGRTIELPAGKVPKPKGVIYNVVRRPLGGPYSNMRQSTGRLVNKRDKDGKVVYEATHDEDGNKILVKDRVPKKVRRGVETEEAFLRRAGREIILEKDEKDNRKDFFMRWRVELTAKDVQRFKDTIFHPIMEGLCDWWESIEADPFNPWQTTPAQNYPEFSEAIRNNPTATPEMIAELDNPIPNPLHWQTPYGVYNPMFGGFKGDFYEYLRSGGKNLSGLTTVPTLYPELSE